MESDDLILRSESEQFADLLLDVRAAAEARGLTFREVMTLMAKRALAELALGVPPDLATCEPAMPAVVRVNATVATHTPRRPNSVPSLIQEVLAESDRPLSAAEICARLPRLARSTIKVSLQKHAGLRWVRVVRGPKRVDWAPLQEAANVA